MKESLLLSGYITGLLVSLPVGPMAILIIQRTANRDLKSGLFSAMGVAFSDSVYAIVAGFSVSFIIVFLREHQTIFQAVAGVVLLLLGLYIFRSHPLEALKKFKRKGTKPMRCFFTAALITISNPGIALAYIAVFASANITFDLHNPHSSLVFMPAFFLGAMSWWIIVTVLINIFRHHFNLRVLWWFNKISGAAIILFVIISTIVIFFRGNPNF